MFVEILILIFFIYDYQVRDNSFASIVVKYILQMDKNNLTLKYNCQVFFWLNTTST